MHDEHVPVWVVEERHQADARVDSLAEKLDSFLGEPLTRNVHIGYAERDSRGVGRERNVLHLRLPEGQRDVRRLELVGVGAAPGHAEYLTVKLTRAGQISRRD